MSREKAFLEDMEQLAKAATPPPELPPAPPAGRPLPGYLTTSPYPTGRPSSPDAAAELRRIDEEILQSQRRQAWLHFAAAALTGVESSITPENSPVNPMAQIAARAATLADAMLAEFEKRFPLR